MNRSHLAKAAGILLAVASGVYFVGYARAAMSGADLSVLLSASTVASIATLTALYAASIIGTTAAWSRLLKDMGQTAGFGQLLAILAATQFGKYLPGNIAHHVGRTGLAHVAGVSLSAAVLSIAYELIIAMVVAAHLGALVLLWSPPHAIAEWPMFEYRIPLLVGVSLGAFVAWWLLPHVARLVARRGDAAAKPLAAAAPLRISTALFCYAAYAVGFFAIGAGLWLVAHALSDRGVPSVLFFMGAFASSWILGLVAPGAPAGLGIREAVLATWLGVFLSPQQAVLLVIALRIATTLGDLANFLLGSTALLRYEAD